MADPASKPTPHVPAPGVTVAHYPLAERPAAAPQRLWVDCAGATDRGLVRPRNEDQFLIAEVARALQIRGSSLPHPHTQFSDERGLLLVVADGMGGHRGGEAASALAVCSVEECVLNTLNQIFCLQPSAEGTVLQEFQAALRQADARMFAEAAHRPELRGMGTTLTLAYVLGTRLFVVHAGDSRCYLLRGGQLHQLTRDHTLVQEMVNRGELAPEQAPHHRLRHVITNAVGGTELGVQGEAHRVELEAGDVVLLCTDGLTEMIPDERIQEILTTEEQPQRACARLIAEANERGGRDNITTIVAHFLCAPVQAHVGTTR
jgi:protein phosphatase